MRYALILLSALLIVGCVKEKSDVITDTTPEDTTVIVPDTTFIIEGLPNNVDIGNYSDTKTFPIHVKYLKGNLQNVTLNVKGMPDGVTAYFEPKSGIASFNTELLLKTKYLKKGVYPIEVTTMSEPGTNYSISHNFDLVVTDTTYTIGEIFSFAARQSKIILDDQPDVIYKGPTILKVSENGYIFNYLLINPDKNFYNSSREPAAFVINSDDRTISIPETTLSVTSVINPAEVVKYRVSGSGNIDIENKTATLKYTSKNATVSYNFTMTFILDL